MDWSVVTTKPRGALIQVCSSRQYPEMGQEGRSCWCKRRQLQSDETEMVNTRIATHSKHIPGPFDAVSDRAPVWKNRREEPSRARNRKPSSLCGPARVTLSPNLTWFGDTDACLAVFFFIKLHGGENGEILMTENGAFRASVQKQTFKKIKIVIGHNSDNKWKFSTPLLNITFIM